MSGKTWFPEYTALTGLVLSAEMLSELVIGTIYCTSKCWLYATSVFWLGSRAPRPQQSWQATLPPMPCIVHTRVGVVTFIRNYAAIHVLPDSSAWSGKIMKSVYAKYCKAMESQSLLTPVPTATMHSQSDQVTAWWNNNIPCPMFLWLLQHTSCCMSCEVCVIYLVLVQVLHQHKQPTIMQWPVSIRCWSHWGTAFLIGSAKRQKKQLLPTHS